MAAEAFASTSREASETFASTSQVASKMSASTSREASETFASTSQVVAPNMSSSTSKVASKISKSTSHEASKTSASTSHEASKAFASTSQASPAVREPKPPKPGYVPRRYVSDNRDENVDNDDPRWKELRDIEHDHQQLKQFVQRKFSNVVPSNPLRSMTFHGFRRRCRIREAGVDVERKFDFSGRKNYNVYIKKGRKIVARDSSTTTTGSRKRPRNWDVAEDDVTAPQAKRMRFDEFLHDMTYVIKKYKFRYLGKSDRERDENWTYYLCHYKVSLKSHCVREFNLEHYSLHPL